MVSVVTGCHWLQGPFYYYADPIRARVIDEQTGKPVAGAAVVAQWQLEFILGGVQTMHKAEALTNASGEFVIPGWGPKLRLPLHRLWYRDPEIAIYKPGYGSTGGDNETAYIPIITREGTSVRETKLPDGRILQPGNGDYSKRDAKRFCYWNDKVFALTPTTSVEEDLSAIDNMRIVLGSHRTEKDFPVVWRVMRDGDLRLPEKQRRGL